MRRSLWGATCAVDQTPEGRRLSVRRVVEAPVEVVWDVLTDTRRWPEWGPTLTGVESPDRYVTAGTRGRVCVLGALWLPFEVTTCENFRWTWAVGGRAATGHFVERHPAGAVVGFELPLVAVAYVPVCAWACARVEGIATGLVEGQ